MCIRDRRCRDPPLARHAEQAERMSAPGSILGHWRWQSAQAVTLVKVAETTNACLHGNTWIHLP
eukprot:12615483-Alexandrium_andersonii.AAC.1